MIVRRDMTYLAACQERGAIRWDLAWFGPVPRVIMMVDGGAWDR